MNKYLLKSFCVMVLTGAMVVGCAKEKPMSVYTSKKPALSFEWAVPADWPREEFGEPSLGFAGVTFLETRSDPKAYRANFTVTAKKADAYKVPASTLEAIADDAAKRCLKLPEARIIKRGSEKVAGRAAAVIDVAYTGLTRIYTPGSQKVSLRQRILIVPQGDLFYVIRYTNEEKRFEDGAPGFARAVKTFRFLP